MSEVPLHNRHLMCVESDLQGYLAHEKPHPPRTLQQDYAYGPIVSLERVGGVLMSEGPCK
jgi:hypothetical protein